MLEALELNLPLKDPYDFPGQRQAYIIRYGGDVNMAKYQTLYCPTNAHKL